MKAMLKGKWSYFSFRHDPIVVKDGVVEGTPELAVPWSPAGVLEVDTNEEGVVSGQLTFAPAIILDIKGRITPANGQVPASIVLTGTFHSSVNALKGYFVPGSDHIVGTILCMANDLAKLPVGTVGPFVLSPLKSN